MMASIERLAEEAVAGRQLAFTPSAAGTAARRGSGSGGKPVLPTSHLGKSALQQAQQAHPLEPAATAVGAAAAAALQSDTWGGGPPAGGTAAAPLPEPAAGLKRQHSGPEQQAQQGAGSTPQQPGSKRPKPGTELPPADAAGLADPAPNADLQYRELPAVRAGVGDPRNGNRAPCLPLPQCTAATARMARRASATWRCCRSSTTRSTSRPATPAPAAAAPPRCARCPARPARQRRGRR